MDGDDPIPQRIVYLPTEKRVMISVQVRARAPAVSADGEDPASGGLFRGVSKSLGKSRAIARNQAPVEPASGGLFRGVSKKSEPFRSESVSIMN